LGGAEGFLILFQVRDENAKSWWNLGGWGNKRHAIEMGGIVGNEVDGSIETGRWYDIRIESKGANLKCYLDNQLVHDVAIPAMATLHASATQVRATGEVLLKVVNAAADPQETQILLHGAPRLAKTAQAIVLTSDSPTDENTLDQPTKVAPVTKFLEISGAAFGHTFPGNSLTVLRLKPQK
jgi:alpha-L-arabinofuranosidase